MLPVRFNRLYGTIIITYLLLGTIGCATTPRPIPDEISGTRMIESGNSAMRNGDYEKATTYYRRALAIDMTDAEAFGNLSVAYYYLQRYDDAIREAMQAVILAPDEINWRLNLGACYSRKGNHESAARAYGVAVKIARGLRREARFLLRNALMGRGRSCELAGWYDQALEAYREALIFSPEDTELLAGIGNIYFRQGHLKEAQTLYNRTIAIDSNHTVAKYNVALIYAKTGLYDEAIKLFADNPTVEKRLEEILAGASVTAVDRSKTNRIMAYRAKQGKMGGTSPLSRQRRPPPYIYLIGLTYYEQGAENAAMKAFEQALLDDPGLAEAYLFIGNINARQENHAAAIKAYENAVAIDSGFVEAYNNLGSMYANTERIEDAMEAYEKALLLNGRFYDARTNLGLLYAESGRLEEAVEEYMEVIRADVGIAEAHNNLGMVYLKQGKHDEAREQFHKAISIRNNFPEAYNNLALSYSRDAMLDDVIETWRGLAARWAGHNSQAQVTFDWLPLRRVPASSSAVGGEARLAYRQGVKAAFTQGLNHALTYFRKAISARPSWDAARLAEAAVLLAQGEWNAAEAALEKVIRKGLKDPLPNAILAIARISGGKYISGITAWEEAVRLSEEPDTAVASQALNAMRPRIETADKIFKALEKAVTLRPNFTIAHFNLGLVNEQWHRYDLAIRSYKNVIQLEPGLATGHFRLGIAYYRQRDYEGARNAMREYVKLTTDPMLLPQAETFMNKSR